jgi:hypothetical protein
MNNRPCSLDDLIARWNFKDPPAGWPLAWERAAASQPAPLSFLADSAIAESAHVCGISSEVQTALLNAATLIRVDPLMTQTAWFLYSLYFAESIPSAAEIWTWPFVSQYANGPAALIPALVVLAGVPRLQSLHRQRNIPPSVTRDSLADIEIWIRAYRRQQGEWGLNNLAWLSHSLAGHLFRLGRLQFIHKPFACPIHAFLHKISGRVLALSAPEAKIRTDGFVDGTNDIYDPHAFNPVFIRSEHSITGHPIHPRGWIRQHPITLSLAEWAPTLAPGDPILDIHIPESGPMDFDLCGESIRQARDFFPRHFPESAPAVALHCSTWFFDFQYQTILPPTSNIVRFQREFYLFPLFSYDREAFRRVFGSTPADLTTAPRNSTLQRAILDFTLAGNRLRCAGGFLLVSDLKWGSAPYQTAGTETVPCSAPVFR